jgi:DNA primase
MDLKELIEQIDIVAFISQYIELEQRGDEFWGLSCFTDEKTPSFSVRQDPPCFYDYSSGIGGNVFTFVRFYHKCSGADAIKILQQYAGCTEENAVIRKKMSATLVCKKFAIPQKRKKESLSVILPSDYMNRYEKNDEKLEIWRAEGISRESLDKFQVYYDSFSDRLVYPIRNINGDIVNVGGRTLDPLWKEKKQRKYTYFHPWGTMSTIYGIAENMDSIINQKEVILFEGCKSVLLADSWGIHNTGAILTSHLSPNQMKILAKLGCRVVFALDKDVDVSADHNINKLRSYVNVEYIYDKENVLDDKDAPVDKGEEVFRKLYVQRLRYSTR